MLQATRLERLTSLRFFAALLVAVHHSRDVWAHGWLSDTLGQIGWLGVTFFFVLSGFVLMWGHTPQTRFAPFITRRLIRIHPLHLATLLVSLLAFATLHVPLAGYRGTPVGTLLNVLLLHDWLPLHPEVRQAWNGVSWTLSCELFFYLCAPFFFPLVLRHWRRMRGGLALLWLGLLALSVVAAARHWDALTDMLQYLPLPRFVEFGIGAVLAVQVRHAPPHLSPVTACLLMALPLALYCAILPETAPLRSPVTMIQLVVPGAAALIAAMAMSDIAQRPGWLRSKVLVLLGEASFALYMTHALLLGVASGVTHRLLPAGMSDLALGEATRLAYLVGAVLLSVATYQFFEHPLRLALLRRFGTRPQIGP